MGFDFPGMVPLFTDPGDEIIFASRTYHSAFPNRIDRVRLSCGIGLRPRDYPVNAPWALSEDARAFMKAFPDHLQPLVKDYVGIDTEWSGDDAMMG